MLATIQLAPNGEAWVIYTDTDIIVRIPTYGAALAYCLEREWTGVLDATDASSIARAAS